MKETHQEKKTRQQKTHQRKIIHKKSPKKAIHQKKFKKQIHRQPTSSSSRKGRPRTSVEWITKPSTVVKYTSQTPKNLTKRILLAKKSSPKPKFTKNIRQQKKN